MVFFAVLVYLYYEGGLVERLWAWLQRIRYFLPF